MSAGGVSGSMIPAAQQAGDGRFRAPCGCKERAQHDQVTVMIPDDSRAPRAEPGAPSPLLTPGNDNGEAATAPIDPRILIIARAIGRQMARDQLDTLPVANDNRPSDEL